MQTTATIKARRAYKSASTEVKNLLNEIFGNDVLTQDTTGLVKTFEDACGLTGENPQDDKFTTGPADETAYRKLKVIAQALNDGWQPDWNDTSQYKYYPWFYMGSAGGGCRFGVCDYACAGSAVGSRLCFSSRALADYAGKQFTAIYKDFFTIQ